MPRQQFFRYIPVVLLAILLAEFALHWWPWEEVNALRTGNRSWGSHGWAAVQLQGLHFRFLAVLTVCFGIALHIIRIVTPPDAQESKHFTPALILAIGSYVLAQALWLMPISDYRLGVTYLPYKLILALVFKVCAVIHLYQVLRRSPEPNPHPQWANTVPAEGTAKPEAVPPQHTFRTTIAVALVMYLLFPLWDVIQLLGISWQVTFRVPAGAAQALKFAVSMLLAILTLRAGIASGIFRPRPDSRPAKYSYRLLAVFLILAPVAMILSAIPYGGGHVPAELKLLISAAQLLGLCALYAMLNKATPPTPSKILDSHNNVSA